MSNLSIETKRELELHIIGNFLIGISVINANMFIYIGGIINNEMEYVSYISIIFILSCILLFATIIDTLLLGIKVYKLIKNNGE